jgi:hypothetical protein
MKKAVINLLFLLILTSLFISSCKKNADDVKSSLLGKWISVSDTIDISSDHDLYKIIHGEGDHYDYKLSQDSIWIQYSGKVLPLLYLGPVKYHFYQLKGDKLTIDFRPYCFGFLSQITSYTRLNAK